MSIMEGYEGMDRQKYKELLLEGDKKSGHKKIGTQKKLGERKREGQKIHRNS